MIKYILVISSLLVFLSCSKSGDYQKNLERLDKIHGICDNPMRENEFGAHNKKGRKYRNCKAKERAGGKSLFDLTDSFEEAFGLGDNENTNVVQSSVNPFLWRAALRIIENYPLKIADNQGGYIETDWIYNGNQKGDRCLIKIQITSLELISTGVKTNFICEVKNQENWIFDNRDYVEEEKQITLKILSSASKISQTNL